MIWKLSFTKKVFQFKVPSGTSRGVLTEKKSWFIKLTTTDNPNIIGVGECSVIPGLSPDYISDEQYEKVLTQIVNAPIEYIHDLDKLIAYPSIYFGLEMALKDYQNGGEARFFDTALVRGEQQIPINGLIWMGEFDFMLTQVRDKIKEGYRCIKLKIGAIDFAREIEILRIIRSAYSAKEIEIRVDANGAFSPSDALNKLEVLAKFDLHSIEQPIKAGNWEVMRKLCANTPLPIALDEELIGIHHFDQKQALMETIIPQFIILKPSLVGGFKGTQEWIDIAEDLTIPWWITSALESNIGLNAIAQFVSQFETGMYQGLGTGSLYVNNLPSKLHVSGGYLSIVQDS